MLFELCYVGVCNSDERSCATTDVLTSLGEPQEILNKSPAQRAHAVRVAKHQHELERRQDQAVVTCARTIAG